MRSKRVQVNSVCAPGQKKEKDTNINSQKYNILCACIVIICIF